MTVNDVIARIQGQNADTPTLEEEKPRRLCLICSKGSLDMAYPPLILANAARMSGVEVDLFFTFWGLDMITKKQMDHLQFTPVGNPTTHIPAFIGGLPGMGTMASRMMRKQIADLDFPPVDEFIEILADAGANLYACLMSMEMMDLGAEDIVDEAEIIGAMEFMEISDGAQIIFI